MIDNEHTFDFKVFYNWFPLFLVVSSIVFPGIGLTALGAFLLQQKFNLSKRNSLISYATVYLLWCFSAFMLYYPNNRMDAYSASLGAVIYVPLHVGAFTIIISLATLIAAYLMRISKTEV